MMAYFDAVIEKLSTDELAILGELFDKDATAVFKSIKNKDIIHAINLTKSKYFSSLSKLNATCLIHTTGAKNSKVYITNYGITAVEEHLKGVDHLC